jgi:hypothetical protein
MITCSHMDLIVCNRILLHFDSLKEASKKSKKGLTYQISHSRPLGLEGQSRAKMKHQCLSLEWAEFFWVKAGSTLQSAKGKCKESATNQVRSQNISRNSNLLQCKYVDICHKRRCTKVVSIQIQDSKKIETRSLASCYPRFDFIIKPVNVNSRIGKKTILGKNDEESFFNKYLTQNLSPLCYLPSN